MISINKFYLPQMQNGDAVAFHTDSLNNGEGRLYSNSLASVITQAQFETSRGSMSVKNAGSGTGVSPGSVSDSHSTVSQ
jgi:hypothetical protein